MNVELALTVATPFQTVTKSVGSYSLALERRVCLGGAVPPVGVDDTPSLEIDNGFRPDSAGWALVTDALWADFLQGGLRAVAQHPSHLIRLDE